LDRKKNIVLYQKWVRDDNYMVLKKTDPEGGVEYKACKARKRGNDVDVYRINRSLRTIKEAILEYADSGERLRSTSAVYMTGTIDSHLVDYDLEYAWQYLVYHGDRQSEEALQKDCCRRIWQGTGERCQGPHLSVMRSLWVGLASFSRYSLF